MLVVSWLSVLVRDIPQLVTVVLQMLFYLSPVIYPVQIIPPHYRFLVTLNPIGVLVVAFRQVLVYGAAPDWSALIYPAALGVALLIFGYRLFKTNEDRMADMA
jgi:lipopolysaccharide transport system permease protein